MSPSEILDPLYAAASKKMPGTLFTDYWKQENLQNFFDLSKDMLMQATQLVHPDPAKPLALRTDASKFSMGGSLDNLMEAVGSL